MQESQKSYSAPSLDELNRQKIEAARKSSLSFFIRRRRVAALAILGIAVWGGIAALSMPREANPEVKVPFGVVTTVFPGASPADVEELVTNKIEDRLQNLDNVKLITSRSSLSFSSVFVEFEASADIDKSIRDLKDAVDEVTDLPEEAEDPEVSEINFNDLPVVTFSLSGDLTDLELKDLGEEVQEELEAIPGVSKAALIGARKREISVKINPGALERLRLPVTAVISALQSANVSLPLGEVELGKTNYNARVSGKFQSVDDLKKVVVSRTPAGEVLLGDIAEVKDELKEVSSLSRVSIAGQKPQPAISLQVFKRTGGNIIQIVDESRKKLKELQDSGVIPPEVSVQVTNDVSTFIRKDFNTLGVSGLQTLVIIFALLTLALSFRKAVAAIFSIPLVFLMALGILSLMGSTLNSLVLFSLVLSMGLLIDTIIVLLEGIHDGLSQGFSPTEAALYSLQTYRWPVTAGVLTTISAFLPMFLVSGILGEFLKTLPMTISATLGSSLFVGLVILPGVAVYFLRRGGRTAPEGKSIFERYITSRLSRFYSRFIKGILKSRRQKKRFVAALLSLFVISVALVALGAISVKMFPEIDIDYFFVNIELPTGSTLAQSDQITRRVEEELVKIPEVKNFVTNIGVALSTMEGHAEVSGSASTANTAQLIVNLVDAEKRERKSFEIAAQLRKAAAGITGAKITVAELTGGPPTGKPVEVRITGEDFASLDKAADQVAKILSQIEGVINIESDNKISPPEFAFELEQDKLGRFGINSALAATQLRAALEGVTATGVSFGGEDIDAVVFVGDDGVSSVEELRNLSLISPAGQVVKLDSVARFLVSPALETIRHRDLDRIVNVRADVKGTSAGVVRKVFEKKLASAELPENIKISFGGEVEDIQQSFTELWYSMIVAVILILFILVLQFDSFKQPVIILLTLPLAVIGVIFGTLLLGLDFGFATFLGIVALAGIVVNDAIILIDRINYNLKSRKLEMSTSIVEAGQARLQPIIMTTLTTIAGVIPLAFADEFWRGLSVAVAFGIAFATVLTLVLVPILYLKLEGKKWLASRSSVLNEK